MRMLRVWVSIVLRIVIEIDNLEHLVTNNKFIMTMSETKPSTALFYAKHLLLYTNQCSQWRFYVISK